MKNLSITIGSRGGEGSAVVRGGGVEEDAPLFESEEEGDSVVGMPVECLLSCSSYILLRSGSVRKIFWPERTRWGPTEKEGREKEGDASDKVSRLEQGSARGKKTHVW